MGFFGRGPTGKRRGQGLIAAVLSTSIALVCWASGLFDQWEYVTWRWRVQFFAHPVAASRNIKLILIDQNSLTWGEKELGLSWPWPRQVYGPIIEFCRRNKARAVIFDLLFTESSVYGVDDDRALGGAVDKGPPFVASMFLGRKSGSTGTWPPDVPERMPLPIAGLDQWLAGGGREEAVFPRATFPIPEVAGSCSALACVSQEPDFDGIFRRYQLFQVFDGRVVPSLGLAAFLAAGPIAPPERSGRVPGAVPGGDGAVTLEHPSGKGGAPGFLRIEKGLLQIADRCIPIDRSGRALMRFRGPPGTYETFSAAAVIQSELRLREGQKPTIEDGAGFEDSYVLLGASAQGLMDLRPTPVGRVCPGVELHATVLDNLLAGDFLRGVSNWVFVPVVFLLTLMSTVMVVTRTQALHCAAVAGVFLSAPAAIAFTAYPLGYWWPIIPQAVAAGFALTSGIFINYVNEGRQRAFIKKAFSQYLSPHVIEEILKDPSRLKLGGERRELSIFFSDLQGFSSISERLDPQALTRLLNDYLSDMTDIILEEGGTLDKYEGDAIIAFWNAPLDQPDNARRACRAAVRCQQRLAERREEFFQRTGVHLFARIGINTGQVVVGNMGSRKRFDYTVLGDTANLASRLEGANKAFGSFTMVSELTWLQSGGDFQGREMGLLRVVGRETPVRVFELTGLPGSDAVDGHDAFRRGLDAFYARDWAAARKEFAALPNDPVAIVYEKRCSRLMTDPEASRNCDCVWNLTEK